MKKIICILLILIFCYSLTSCKNVTDSDNNELSSNEINQSTKDEDNADNTALNSKSLNYIEEFVSKYNSMTSIPITERVQFDPKNKESNHYRTEYRLAAWDGSIAETAIIGNANIDIVNYGSNGGYYENTNLRIYVVTSSKDDLFNIFSTAAKVMDETVTDNEIQDVIAHVNEYGDYNGFCIGKLSPGTISNGELMLDIRR